MNKKKTCEFDPENTVKLANRIAMLTLGLEERHTPYDTTRHQLEA